MRQLRVRFVRHVRSRERRKTHTHKDDAIWMFLYFFASKEKIERADRLTRWNSRSHDSSQEHQQTREELLNRVHALKSELQEWRYKMDGQVKNYKGELAALKETLASETAALRRELEETSERLKRQAVTTRDEHHHSTQSPGGRLHRLPSPP